MSVIWQSVITFLLGAGGLALLEWGREAWRHRASRKDVKEDRQAEKVDKMQKLTDSVDAVRKEQEEQGQQLDALREAMKCVLLDRIMYLGQHYIADGEIDFDDRRRLREMHTAYHSGLKGNGDADAIMRSVDDLPLKQ